MILVRIRNVSRHSADMVRQWPASQVSENIPKYVQLKVAVTRDKTQGKICNLSDGKSEDNLPVLMLS